MGLDVYVGPLTRYMLGDWLTVTQQAGQDQGLDVQIVSANQPWSHDELADPQVTATVVRAWQDQLLTEIEVTDGWPDQPASPYWTDKPGWDGYGGMVLLAAYDEQPGLRPGRGSHNGLFRRSPAPDSPSQFARASAYKKASAKPRNYLTLLSGVEWWLPLPTGPAIINGTCVTGQPVRMASVDQLVIELDRLTARLGLKNKLAALRRAGPPRNPNDLDGVGRFGLAVFHALAHTAQEVRQPLILDY